ncbi:MAG: hypothetical protein ABJL55_02220 [Roseibium sp.]
MSIDMSTLQEAITRESGAAIDRINKLAKNMRDLSWFEKERAYDNLLDNFRGFYACRTLTFDTESGRWSERWDISFGDDFRNAVKISDDYLVEEDDTRVAALVAKNWNKNLDQVFRRDASGYQSLYDDEPLYKARP